MESSQVNYKVGDTVRVKLGKFRGLNYEIIAVREGFVSFSKLTDGTYIWIRFEHLKPPRKLYIK